MRDIEEDLSSVQPIRSLRLSVHQCYLFHMYVGVRAGGGIGDEIEDPAGDPYELYRILFDITFFFFVIVILLAIIQGISTRSIFLQCVCACVCIIIVITPVMFVCMQV